MALTLFSYFIIPGLTLFLARGTDWLSTNFSSIRSAFSRQGEFLLWSLTAGGYFYLTTVKLLKARGRIENLKRETVLFALSAAAMALFVLTPYLPARFPFLSFLHVVTALSCCLLFSLCLFSLILRGYLRSPGSYRPCLIGFYLAGVLCICLFLLTGIINSAMEICFVLACSFLTRRLLLLEKRPGPTGGRTSVSL